MNNPNEDSFISSDLNDKPRLIGMTTAELEQFVESLGEKKYRGKQIAAWIYKRNAADFDGMTDLSADFRAKLSENSVLYRSAVESTVTSPDGAAKFLLKLEDGRHIETVLLPYEDRLSICVSSQVGCAVGCLFCASALGGFERNLTAGEIVDQALTLQQQISRRISNVVYMGMGEPLLNYHNVMKSLHILNQEIGVSMRNITISTVGITPRIHRMASEKLQLTLAVSLHAPNDHVRRKIMPIAKRYPLKDLIPTCKRYADQTGRRVTFEYLLIRGVNDGLQLARQLADLLKGILCNVNLIPYNEVEGIPLMRPTKAHVKEFRKVLEDGGIEVTQRYERGHSVAAACGQLRLRENKGTNENE